jgi:hypothetical protein
MPLFYTVLGIAIGCILMLAAYRPQRMQSYQYKRILADMIDLAKIAVSMQAHTPIEFSVKAAMLQISEAEKLLEEKPELKSDTMLTALMERVNAIETLTGRAVKELIVTPDEWINIKHELEALRVIEKTELKSLIFQGITIRMEHSVREKIDAERPAFLSKVMD